MWPTKSWLQKGPCVALGDSLASTPQDPGNGLIALTLHFSFSSQAFARIDKQCIVKCPTTNVLQSTVGALELNGPGFIPEPTQ